jgi:hypothetical protein
MISEWELFGTYFSVGESVMRLRISERQLRQAIGSGEAVRNRDSNSHAPSEYLFWPTSLPVARPPRCFFSDSASPPALRVLRSLPAEKLGEHSVEILKLLRDPADSVRGEALRVLRSLPAEKLGEQAGEVLRILRDPRYLGQYGAAATYLGVRVCCVSRAGALLRRRDTSVSAC